MCSRCSPAARPTGRSAARCSSRRRRPACTCPTSSASSARPAGPRRWRSRTGGGWCRCRRRRQRGKAGRVTSQPAPWWRTAVFYEVYLRSFADGDGDGVGDLAGLRHRLPYLADLGVDALWITPFYPSPMVDHGYDVADPRDVDPLFGSLADFDDLVAAAHKLGIKVTVDLVPNHTSDRHADFAAALADGPGSPARARYVFRDGTGEDGSEPPNNWRSV